MSRPAWLGPPPTGARAAAIMLRAHLRVALAYAEIGRPVPFVTGANVALWLERLIAELRAEL